VLKSGGTDIHDADGNIRLAFRNGKSTRIDARNGEPVNIYDREGSFYALKYKTSASAPGTLELTSANLNANDNSVSGVLRLDLNEAGSGVSSPSEGATLWVDSNDGDLKVQFANGTEKTIATN
jgi:hypothetical protein